MRRGFALIWALLTAAIATVVGIFSYQAGMAAGLAAKVPEGAAAVAPYWYYGPHFFGFGFGFLGCLFPLLGFFLIFSLIRLIFWRGGWGGRHGWGRHGWGGPEGQGQDFGPGGQGVPPMFSEWHKRAHGEQTPPPPAQ